MKQRIQQIIAIAKKTKLVSFDMEYEIPQSYYDDDFHLHGCSFAVRDGDEIVAEYFTDFADIQEILDECFNDAAECVAHFAMADIMCLEASGFVLGEALFKCTAMALNLLEEERFPNQLGLKVITPEFLGYSLTEFAEAEEYGMDSDEFKEYAVNDSIATLKLYEIFKKGLIQEKLWSVYGLISPSLRVFADTMRAGLHIDTEVANTLFDKFCYLRDEVEEEVYKMIGYVDLNSPKQLGQRLFHEMGFTAKNLEVSNKTGLISTGAKNMAKLAVKYPAVEAILAYRSCEKAISTYLEPLTIQFLSNDDHRIHTLFWLISTTGRTRSSGPNVQNVTNQLGKNIIHNDDLKAAFNDLKIREMFSAPPGYKMVICDYSSLEYRTSSLAAPEPVLIQMYKEWECKECGFAGESSDVIRNCTECDQPVTQGKDLHAFNRDISNKAGANINRGQAKAVSFLAIFAGGAWRLSQDLKLSYDICENILHSVMDRFKGLTAWHKRTEKIVSTTGEVRDMFGRRRKINLKERLKDQPTDRHRGIKKNCLNMLVNFVAQSPGSIITQIAMQNVRKRLIKEGLYDTVKIVNMIHDEIVLYAPEELAERVLELVTFEMENAVELPIPFPVSGGVYDNWSQAK